MQEYRNFKGELRNLRKRNEFTFEVSLWLLSSGVNRNGWEYTDLEKNKDLFLSTPILVAYVNRGKTVGDGHNFQTKRDTATGEEYASFTADTAERIVGIMSDDPNDIQVVEENGRTWIVGKGYLWAWYARELVDKIKADAEAGHEMSISIETLVSKSHMEGDVEVMDDWIVLGTTILGDDVMPAVEDARIMKLQEVTSGFAELKVRAASYIQNEDVDEEPDDEPEDEGEIDEEEPEEVEGDPGDEDDTEIIENEIEKAQFEINERKIEMKTFSKKQLAELSTKFSDYTVLAAAQDENGIHVCLMSKDGANAIYTMDGMDDAITESKIQKYNAQVHFNFGEGCEVVVDSCELTDKPIADSIKANNDLAEKIAELEKANATIADMTAKEMARRIQAAKNSAKVTLEKFNMNREDKVSEKILEAINESIDNGEFSECADGEGNWCGEEVVAEKVLAACAKEVMKADEVSASARHNQYVWDKVGKKKVATGDDVVDLLSRLGIE